MLDLGSANKNSRIGEAPEPSMRGGVAGFLI